MSKYFPKEYKPFVGDINLKVDSSNYATKADIKNITHIDTSKFALKTNVAILKTEIDKLDIDKLVSVPVDLSKLSDVVKNVVIKKDEYNKLPNKVNNIDTSRFILKTKYDGDKLELEKKFLTLVILSKNQTASTAVENKIPSTNNLVKKKKTDYNAKITEVENKITNNKHDEYITTPESHKLAADAFNARIAQANVITKTDFDARLSGLNRKITKNKSDHVFANNELNKLKTFDFAYFIGKSHFEDGVQNYLVLQPVYRYFKFISNTNFISEWISKDYFLKVLSRLQHLIIALHLQ